MNRLLAVVATCLLAACTLPENKSAVQVVKETFSSPGTDATIFSTIKPGAYVPSTLVIGEERDLAQRRSIGPGYVHAEALERYLQGIRTRLLASSGVTGVPGRTRVLADGSFSAFSTADGNVYIAMGWFENFSNEDEIAALMAHELSHVLLKHHTSDIVSKMQKQTLSYMTYGVEAQKQFGQLVDSVNQASGKAPATKSAPAAKTSATKSDSGSRLLDALSTAGDAVSRVTGTETKGTNNAKPATKTATKSSGSNAGASASDTELKEKRLLRRVQWSIDVTDKAILPAWGKTQEREADLLGVDLLVKARYNKAAMSAMLSKLKEAEDLRAADDRNRQGQFSLVASELGAGNWDEAARVAFSDVLASLAESHPPTGDRIDGVDAYVGKFYPERDGKPFDVESWRRIRNDATTTAYIANYGKAFSAEQMIRKADVKVAYRLAKQAASGATAGESYTNWVAALSAEANNANGDARGYFQKAINAREPINAAYEAYVSSLERAAQYSSALAESEKASKLFGDVPTWTVTRIRILRKLGDANAARKLEVQCGVDTPDYRRACGDAANTPLGGSGKATTTQAKTTPPKTR